MSAASLVIGSSTTAITLPCSASTSAALGQREAIAFGDGVSLPVRIKFDELPRHCMPRSSTARFTEKWQRSVGDEGFLESIVERWRNSSSASPADAAQHMAHFAESVNLQGGNGADPATPPASGDERGIRSREPASDPASRRELATARREPGAPAASGPQPDTSLRALREKLQQR